MKKNNNIHNTIIMVMLTIAIILFLLLINNNQDKAIDVKIKSFVTKDSGLISIEEKYFYDIYVNLEVHNNTNQTIGGFIGELEIYDAFGNILQNISIESDRNFPPGVSESTILIDYINKDRARKMQRAEKLKYQFKLKKVI